MILGTAGHVDHGKTALVRGLTGVDTDRLAEEKRRGITIELGFAPLALEDGQVLGVVDVPGHEAFVRTMVAGATGIDLALLVVAADEGIMPQTREHLHILDLLGTRGGVVALTKCDLVDDEWLALVEDELRATIAHSPLAGAAIVRTSVVTGTGLEALRAALSRAVQRLPRRSPLDLFRLPVDRAFSVHGTGTVVTGTVWTGTVERDARVRVLPQGASARVRAIEVHGSPVPRAISGTRAALALSGIELAAIARGSVIVAESTWQPTTMLLAEVALLDDAPVELGPRRSVRLHLGTSDVGARIVAMGGVIAPGEVRQARIALSDPVVARAGDRFVLRTGSPVTTVGGGVVNDPLPARARARPWSRGAATPAERLTALIDAEGDRGLALESLPLRMGVAPGELPALIASSSPPAAIVGDRLYPVAQLASHRDRLLRLVDDFHAAEPLEPGISLQRLRSQLEVSVEVADRLLGELLADGRLRSEAGHVARTGWEPRFTAEQERVALVLLDTLRRQGSEPESVAELSATLGAGIPAILRHLERTRAVEQVAPDRYYDRAAVEAMVGALRLALESGMPASPASLREALGISRKYLIPFLEYCDRSGVTERRGEGRVLRGNGPVPRKMAGGLLDT